MNDILRLCFCEVLLQFYCMITKKRLNAALFLHHGCVFELNTSRKLKGNDFLFIHMDITISASVYKNLL